MKNMKVETHPMGEEEMNKKIGKLLWGKDGKEFSMGRLIKAFMKKRVKSWFN
ncbi:MAG: hypothetical protein GF317_00065 [Candidatus Lokiarchaeota archaeon]|nr:hypothetical protein [Candidatus Lokiarchaeota archaeon]MBD3198380.1 hypothetical protein [Candidatus Lokiarchaeota archaeon]